MNTEEKLHTRYIVAASWGNDRFYFDDTVRSKHPQDVKWFTDKSEALSMLEKVKVSAPARGWRMKNKSLTIEEIFSPMPHL